MNYTEEEIRNAVFDSVRQTENGDVVTRGLYKRPYSFASDVIRRLQKPPRVSARLEGTELVMVLDNGQRFRVSVTDLGS